MILADIDVPYSEVFLNVHWSPQKKTNRYRYAIAMWDRIPPLLAIGLLDMGCLRIAEIVWIKSIRSSYAEEKKN